MLLASDGSIWAGNQRNIRFFAQLSSLQLYYLLFVDMMTNLQKASGSVLFEEVDVFLLYIIVCFTQNASAQAVVMRMLSKVENSSSKEMRGT